MMIWKINLEQLHNIGSLQKIEKDLLNTDLDNLDTELQDIEKELENSGMQFIEVDKEAFIEKGSAAVYANLTPEMKEIYDQIISMK